MILLYKTLLWGSNPRGWNERHM